MAYANVGPDFALNGGMMNRYDSKPPYRFGDLLKALYANKENSDYGTDDDDVPTEDYDATVVL